MDLFDILLRLCLFFLSFILSSETVDSSQDKDVSSDEDETVQPTTEATGKDIHDDTDEDDHETSENIGRVWLVTGDTRTRKILGELLFF